MAGEDWPQRLRLDATSLGSPEIAPGSEISASGIVASVDADGRVITVGRARVTLDRKEIPLRGQTLVVVTQETLASAFKRNVAKLAWAVSAGICASLLLALLVAADYNDLFDLEPRYWELLLKVIA